MEIKDATTTSLADDLKELNLDHPVSKQALKVRLKFCSISDLQTAFKSYFYLKMQLQNVAFPAFYFQAPHKICHTNLQFWLFTHCLYYV